jgi:hypothetical protein
MQGQDFRKDHLGLRSWSATSHRVEQRLLAPLLNVCPRRAADFSHCAYSASLSLVPSDRPRNCFGEPFCWVASIKARAVLFQVRPRAGPSCFTGNRSAEGRRVVSCFPCSPTGGLTWDATTLSKSAQTKWTSHKINRFAYANQAALRWSQKRRKPLRAKTFAYANAPFAYANPGRGDVSPFCRRASAVFSTSGFSAEDFAEDFIESSPSVNWTSVFAGAVCRADQSHTYRLHRDPA